MVEAESGAFSPRSSRRAGSKSPPERPSRESRANRRWVAAERYRRLGRIADSNGGSSGLGSVYGINIPVGPLLIILRNGYARPREIGIGTWSVPVRAPRLSDLPPEGSPVNAGPRS